MVLINNNTEHDTEQDTTQHTDMTSDPECKHQLHCNLKINVSILTKSQANHD